MKTLICVPCMDQVAAPFAHALASLKKVGECSVSFLIGSLIYDSRNKFAKQAYTTGADYVVWFDSDMTFPSDAMERMIADLESGQCGDIVTGLYFRRVAPYTPVLFAGKNDQGGWNGYEDYQKHGANPFEVAGCGFGCVAMKKNVLIDLMITYGGNVFTPYDGLGEDLAFCQRARENGHKIYCDPTIKCGHVGHVVIDETIFNTSKMA